MVKRSAAPTLARGDKAFPWGPVCANSTIVNLLPKPSWLKTRLPGLGQYYVVRKQLSQLGVHTVCEEARCPNAAECWGGGTATLMILGEVCTRGCRFCAVTSGHPAEPPAVDEPARVAEAVAALELRYAVITSVDRDDLPDGGAGHFALTLQAIGQRCPKTVVELLTPDFGGQESALSMIVAAGAQVIGHNLETTRALTRAVRDRRCSYDLSLQVLRGYRALDPRPVIKSSLLLGLGETNEEIEGTLLDLRQAGVDWVTLGQYLRPSRKHLPVQRFVEPEAFATLAAQARAMGFPLVTAGPLVRSSYRAAEEHAEQLVQKRQAIHRR
jgi:lipoyl synthase